MDPASLVILAFGAIASLIVFLLLRFPRFRRAQFRGHPPFSLPVSALGALLVFAAFALFLLLQR